MGSYQQAQLFQLPRLPLEKEKKEQVKFPG